MQMRLESILRVGLFSVSGIVRHVAIGIQPQFKRMGRGGVGDVRDRELLIHHFLYVNREIKRHCQFDFVS